MEQRSQKRRPSIQRKKRNNTKKLQRRKRRMEKYRKLPNQRPTKSNNSTPRNLQRRNKKRGPRQLNLPFLKCPEKSKIFGTFARKGGTRKWNTN